MTPQEFATQAHTGQLRKYTYLPYIVHPEAVVRIVRGVPHDNAMLAAAWLHDVVEDCGVSIRKIAESFGSDVADLVGWLTDISIPSDGNREMRKAIDRAHSAEAPARAQTIKVADIIDNLSTIVALDPGFAKVYVPEKKLLLDVLTKADVHLISIAKSLASRVGFEPTT